MSQKNERNEENTCCAIQSLLGETRMHKNEQINITYFKSRRSNFGTYLCANSLRCRIVTDGFEMRIESYMDCCYSG